MEDVRWLGFDWEDRLFYASDYFEQLYEWAVAADQEGQGLRLRPDAPTQIREYRGTLTEPGKNSPYRDRSRRGEPRPVRADAGRRVPRRRAHAAGEDRHGLAQPQPARPGDVPHPARRRTIAPATSGASTRCTTTRTASRDSIEGITHSICTLEFENHRPLYDWFLEAARHLPPAADRVRPAEPDLHGDEQAQAAASWCKDGHVSGWDDPRMPTICGLRRRGYTPEAIRDVLRAHRRRQVRQHRSTSACWSTAMREDLNKRAPRVMAVLRPLKVVIDELSGGPGRGAGRGQQSRGRRRRARARCRSRASCTSSRTTSARTRRRSSSAWRPAARCGCATPTSSRARAW